jgi:hypothetical protein
VGKPLLSDCERTCEQLVQWNAEQTGSQRKRDGVGIDTASEFLHISESEKAFGLYIESLRSFQMVRLKVQSCSTRMGPRIWLRYFWRSIERDSHWRS